MKVPNRTCTVIVFGLGVIFLGVHSLWPQSVSKPSTSSPSGGQLNRAVEVPFDATMWDEHVFPDGTRYRINLSTATFLFDIEPWSEKDLRLANMLAVNYRDAINAAKGTGYKWITSVDVVCGITKHQEDAVMAVIERAIASAARSYVIALEKELQKHVANGTKTLRAAHDWAEAACMLALGRDQTPNKAAEAILARFRQKTEWSAPIGPFTASEELRQAWQLHRYLMTPLPVVMGDSGLTEDELCLVWAELLRTTAANPSTRKDFVRFSKWAGLLEESSTMPSGEKLLLAADASLPTSGPMDLSSVRALSNQFRNFFPEGLTLIPRVIGMEDSAIALAGLKGVSPMEVVIKVFMHLPQNVDIDGNSGWYARQRYALLPLLRPQDSIESKKMVLTQAYQDRLKKAFKASLTKVRETHAAWRPTVLPALQAKPKIYILKPALSLEPQATVYLRMAETARWLRQQIDVVSAEDPSTDWQEAQQQLREIENRSLGLYLVALRELGMSDASWRSNWPHADHLSLMSAAEKWLCSWPTSDLAGVDTRVAIPVLRERGKITYWATVGVQLLKLKVAFVHPPELEVVNKRGEFERANWTEKLQCSIADAIVVVRPETFLVPADVFVEFTRGGKPLSREGFRALLPKKGTVDRTLDSLK